MNNANFQIAIDMLERECIRLHDLAMRAVADREQVLDQLKDVQDKLMSFAERALNS